MTTANARWGVRPTDIVVHAPASKEKREHVRAVKATAPASTVERGIMVALPVPLDVAEKIAVEEGEPPERMHVTLAYLGKLGEDIGEERPDEMADIMRGVSRAIAPVLQSPPLTGVIAGVASFDDNGDGAPHYTRPEVPGLKSFRARIVSALQENGHELKGHGAEGDYIPHVTLRYGGAQPDPIPETPVTFDEVLVKVGTEERRFHLTGVKRIHGGRRAVPKEAE
jgi:2'-5' RNA ligase